MQGHVEWNKHITLLLRIASEKKVPEWRFGQLIENLKRYMGSDDLFYVEDCMLAEAIINFFDLDEEFRKDFRPDTEVKNMINEFKGQYYFLSNFYTAPVTWCGITYQNNEAAFQSAKVLDNSLRKEFAELDPASAKKMGRRVCLRDDWEAVKYDIMYEICLAKFTQNEDLKTGLLATGDKHLEEGNTWGDKIWGTVNGEGENNLGKILMRVRAELR